ncbi:AAA family ATPase [Shewanella algae]|uniref:AAA family ATPase n=1 Tax=Shewanella algae TaxID=38313 RepID=UPI001AAD0EFA|nr:AAA family ATPase [Shewanella algae]MBO2650766.1 AAA family ATPase [Shewanella algae]
MLFKKIKISAWRQFKEIEIDFHPKITIITGANGAGKTTLLRFLSQHFGWTPNLLATPKISAETGLIKYATGLFRRIFDAHDSTPRNSVGSLTYSNDIVSHIVVPESGGVQYNVEIHNQQSVVGLHINSHRPIQSYQQISSIPTNAIGAEQAYSNYFSELMQKYQGGYTQFSPMYRMKESIISMATFGPGNANVQGNPELARLFLEFKTILTKVLPPTIGFEDISIRIPDVVLVTKSGEFVLDAASGGLMSIIDLSWQIFLFSHNKEEFTVTIDEPENHLHPSMQRSLLGRLVAAFPKAQFIVVTHSPFVVSSVKDSYVYALRYTEDTPTENEDFQVRNVSSIRLDLNAKAATASEILRDVLGVPVTLPEWAEADLKDITQEFCGKPITGNNLDLLRVKLRNAGLSEYLPDALKIIVA